MPVSEMPMGRLRAVWNGFGREASESGCGPVETEAWRGEPIPARLEEH